MNTDFRVQHLNGKPVLTFWQGTLATPPAYTNVPAGSSEPGSCYYILDNTYRVIKTVTAQYGFTSDVHEFLITPANTALLLSTRAVPMNLSAVWRPVKRICSRFRDPGNRFADEYRSVFLGCADRTSRLPIHMSRHRARPPPATYGTPIISILSGSRTARRISWCPGAITSTIYRINKPTGRIVWQLGGKQSNFTIESGAEFSWQHDARFLPDNVVSMFDDNCCENNAAPVPPGTPPSHGLFLQLDLTNMTASLQKEYYHDPNLNIGSQGNTQSLANGNVFNGWGQSAYYGEFAPGGNSECDPASNTLYDAQMPGSNYTYRAYREDWVGMPYYPPSIAVQSSDGQTTVYASWNGATEVKTWEVFGGNFPYILRPLKSAAKSGFETAIPVTNARYYQVKALNSFGQVIGVSRFVRAS